MRDDYSHPDWVESTFDRDMRVSERWDRLEMKELREQEAVDRVREHGGFPAEPKTRKQERRKAA